MRDKFNNFVKSLNLDSILESALMNGFNAIIEAYEDKLPGGLADKKTPKDFDQEQLNKGIKVELEHTKDHGLAREIAMDHLTEDNDYYIKLEKMESK